MEDSGDRVWEAVRRAALHAWLGWIEVLLNLDGAYEVSSMLQQSAKRSLLAVKHWRPQ